MSEPIKLGLVGVGRAGWGMHCPELAGREDEFQIVAACDLIPARRERMAERYRCQTYERIEDLIADPGVELVDIATRSCDHVSHAILALATGKYVYLEKPIATSYDEACRLMESAAKAPGHLYVRHNRRVDPDFIQIREIIASGVLGEVYEVRLARHGYNRRNDWQTLKRFGGGLLLNWGPHIVDHALRLLDSPVADLWSDLKRIVAVGDTEDHIKIIFKGANGRVVDMEISSGVAIEAPTYHIFGTRGTLMTVGDTIRLRYLSPDTPPDSRQPDPETPGEGFGSAEGLTWVDEAIPARTESNAILWNMLYAAIREGAAFPITLDEALEVMRMISAAKEGHNVL
jgi:scyllo-inositol 2-dehydrogenase (NADP+)